MMVPRLWFGAAVSVGALLSAAAAMAQAGDAANGRRVFYEECLVCHTMDKNGASKIGPSLRGVLGRRAGTVKRFVFSTAMIGAGITWDEKTLGEYSRGPRSLVPGTKSNYPGLNAQDQLDDLIAYLKEATK